MLLKHPSIHAQSIKQLKRYSSVDFIDKLENSKPLNKNNSSSCLKTKRSKQFIPFCHQRNLGRLISSEFKGNKKISEHGSIEGLLQIINFRNFKKLYTMQKRNEQCKYAEKIRNSGQKNLINESQWLNKDIRKKTISLFSKKHSLQSLDSSIKSDLKQNSMLRNCCQMTERHLNSSQKVNKPASNFHKIDQQLYKKISVNRPPTDSNHQLINFYQHYVQACELNQNQRRLFLTKKIK